jgi:hypothetical protein
VHARRVGVELAPVVGLRATVVAVGVVRCGAVRVLVVVKVTFQVQVYKLSALLQNGGVPKLYSRGRTTHTSKSLLTSTV